jgi:hypothetical protein
MNAALMINLSRIPQILKALYREVFTSGVFKVPIEVIVIDFRLEVPHICGG